MDVAKTNKLWIGGAFVRSEGGRTAPFAGPDGGVAAHLPLATCKDLRDAVTAARAAQPAWASRSAFLRGQILYRAAEMLESRRAPLAERLRAWHGGSAEDSAAEAACAVDRAFWYAGWADKLAQVLGSVNPVAQPYFDFTLPEPTGVAVVLAPRSAPLLGLVSAAWPVLVPGNALVLVAETPLAVELAEILSLSDLPPGTVNILTGRRADLAEPAASHDEVDAIACFGGTPAEERTIGEAASTNVKRVLLHDDPPRATWREPGMQGLDAIERFVELKTTWHPISP